MRRAWLMGILLLCSPSYATVPLEKAAKLLNERLLAIRSMTASFSQQVYQDGTLLQKTSGKLSIMRPGRFRWQEKHPSSQLIIADGKRLWVYDKALEQVTVKSQAESLSGTPALFLSDADNDLLKRYHVVVQAAKKQQVFILSPKRGETSFKSIKLGFVGPRLQQMVLEDTLGQVSRITFSSVTLNPSLRSRLFHFNPPADVDIIRE